MYIRSAAYLRRYLHIEIQGRLSFWFGLASACHGKDSSKQLPCISLTHTLSLSTAQVYKLEEIEVIFLTWHDGVAS